EDHAGERDHDTAESEAEVDEGAEHRVSSGDRGAQSSAAVEPGSSVEPARPVEPASSAESSCCAPVTTTRSPAATPPATNQPSPVGRSRRPSRRAKVPSAVCTYTKTRPACRSTAALGTSTPACEEPGTASHPVSAVPGGQGGRSTRRRKPRPWVVGSVSGAPPTMVPSPRPPSPSPRAATPP